VSQPPPRAASEQLGDVPQNIVTAIAEVSEQAALLVHEEIELAKAEVAEKAGKLARGTAVGVVAGVFLITSLLFVAIGGAWLLYFYLPGDTYAYFWGFFAMALILALLGVLAGLIARKVVMKAAPPTPDMAIEEARRIRATVGAGSGPEVDGSARPSASAASAASGRLPAPAGAPAAPRAAQGAGTPAGPYAPGGSGTSAEPGAPSGPEAAG